MKHPVCQDGVTAVVAGLLLYAAATGVETFLTAGPMVSAILEELGKMLLLVGFGWSGRSAARERHPLRQARARALGAARGLSLGLVAVVAFAGAENLGYLIAFQEAGILARLLWSLPVHLVAALSEALGVLFLLRCLEGKRDFRPRLVGISAWFAGTGLAMAWHVGANILVSNSLTPSVFAGGVVLANLLFLVFMLLFLRQAYIGGFLHGAD